MKSSPVIALLLAFGLLTHAADPRPNILFIAIDGSAAWAGIHR
jgi:hypothetical protein